ncbi:hypothetical protein E1B28_008524 [Marasmius oreades]|uniref:DUF6699 domain-containing protein n=1 Tax=Marasmius oreades TaxID=181124 RepID=A0A9P7RZ86_9AGAR|nr:uncharacterized protein E1B28_008524 [Marasmius oreades]KAG7092155.1 hypothetical protein E1B28_008524 [Marasmius oreades]
MANPFPGWGNSGRDLGAEHMPPGIELTRGGVPVGIGGGGRIPPPMGASGPGAITYNAFPGHTGAFTAPTHPTTLPAQGWTYGQYAPSPHFPHPTPASAPAWQLQASPNRNPGAPDGFSSTVWQPPERRRTEGNGWLGEADAHSRWNTHRRNVDPRGEDDDNRGWDDSGRSGDDWGRQHAGQDSADLGWGSSWDDEARRGRRDRRDTWAGRDARDWQHRLKRQGWGDDDLDEEDNENDDNLEWGHDPEHGTRNGGGNSWFDNAHRSRSNGPANRPQVPPVSRDWANDMDAIPDWHREAHFGATNGQEFDEEDIEDERHAREVEDRMRAPTPIRNKHRSKSRKRETGYGLHQDPERWGQQGLDGWGQRGLEGQGQQGLDGWGEQGVNGWGRERGPEDRARDVEVQRLRARDREERLHREQREHGRQRKPRGNLGWGDTDEDPHRGGGGGTDWDFVDAMGGLSINGRRTPHPSTPHQAGALTLAHKKYKKRSRSVSAHRNPLFDGYHVTYEQHKSRNGLFGGPREEDLPFRPNTWREGYSVRSGGGGVGKGWLGMGARRGSEVKEINDTVRRTLHPHLSFTPGTSASGIFSPYSPNSGPVPPPISLDLRILPSLPYSLKSFLPSLHLLELPRSPNTTPTHVDLMQYATHPPTTQMRMFHRRLPWYIDVVAGTSGMNPGGRGGYVTVWDVIVGLYVNLVGGESTGGESQVRAEEYWSGEMGDHVDVTPPPVSGPLPGSTPLLGSNLGMGRKAKRSAREQVSMSWRLRGQLASQIKYALVMTQSGMDDVAQAEAVKAEQVELQRGVRRVDWLSVGAYVGAGGEGGRSDARAFRWLGLRKAKRGMWEIVTEV